jgi:aspartate-semialdehyde dehydrogenase
MYVEQNPESCSGDHSRCQIIMSLMQMNGLESRIDVREIIASTKSAVSVNNAAHGDHAKESIGCL